MTRRFSPALIAAFMLVPGIAVAQERCDFLVDDQAHVISDTARVTTAAKSLGNTGVTPRVRTIESIGDAVNLDKFAAALRDQCPSWQSGGGWKSTMLLLMFAPHQKNDIGIYYGASNVSKLGGGKWQDILRDRFVPQVVAFDHGDKAALTLGFINTLTEIQAVMARPSVGGATTINQAADYSGLWTALRWLMLPLMLAALAGGAWVFFTARGRRQSAQAEARRVRSECVSGILDITDETGITLLEATIAATPEEKRAALQAKLTKYKSLGSFSLQTLSSFDNMSGEDPNNKALSVEAYESNRKRYETISRNYVTPGKWLRDEINAGDVSDRAYTEERPRYWGQYAPNKPMRPAETRPANTSSTAGGNVTPSTVIVNQGGSNDGFVTGMILGDALSRDRYYPPPFPSPPPYRGSDSGGSASGDSSSSKSSDTGGSFSIDTSSSSDSGGSSSSSDSGGSSSSSSC